MKPFLSIFIFTQKWFYEYVALKTELHKYIDKFKILYTDIFINFSYNNI